MNNTEPDALDEILEQVFRYGVGTSSEDIIGSDTAYENLKKHAVKDAKQKLQAYITKQNIEARIDTLDTIVNRKAEIGMWQSYLEVIGNYKKELKSQQEIE